MRRFAFGLVLLVHCSSAPADDVIDDDGGDAKESGSSKDASGDTTPPGVDSGTDAGSTDAAVDVEDPCTGAAPLVDGSTHYCPEGFCYCAKKDNCNTIALSASCCGGIVKCY